MLQLTRHYESAKWCIEGRTISLCLLRILLPDQPYNILLVLNITYILLQIGRLLLISSTTFDVCVKDHCNHIHVSAILVRHYTHLRICYYKLTTYKLVYYNNYLQTAKRVVTTFQHDTISN